MPPVYFHDLDPIAVALGPLKVHWYGLMYLLAFVSAWWLGRSRIRKGRLPGVDDNAFGDLMFYGMLGVVLGGRLGYILFYDFKTYIADPLQMLKVWEGGMSFHGGLIGVLIAVFWWARKHRLHFFDVVDFVAPLIPLGLGFGRLGNWINGELWGKPTDGNWGVIFPGSLPAELQHLPANSLRAMAESGVLDQYARHPSQLYQMVWEGIVMFALLWWYSSKPRPRYAVAGMFALLYGAFRFVVEFVRLPDPQLGYLAFGWLTMGQVLSLPLIALGLYWLWKSHSQPTLQPQLPEEAN
ncbi:prolipoprotein diacylglyceryl transferase [Solilutibacter tolerans]|uniref:Phosphatidylglycerol--prolipoprotein diacylglyceryl transferase n=1 Tax=Solilutibacter tolerans TaxID=1604334 RepID=A0A1N6TV61_9GAMM|nr:prolipoprotein diacylglyceryl transferase [Lysobacter tolerans]SIQ57214.1 phosphatidylglycerol:prolipoprotein diacylglycerol transferase [Lysobacter tolerans]